MSKALDPTFRNPPVLERILGVQFEQLPLFTGAHIGWFWKTKLDSEWTVISETVKIEEKFERFGADRKWALNAAQLQLIANSPSNRFQIVRATDDRMIQVQDTRFHLNWRKREDHDYINYEELIIEFLEYLNLFTKFCSESCGVDLKVNQWEITYINHVQKGNLWNQIYDWFDLIPNLSVPGVDKSGAEKLESLKCDWTILLDNNVGRLHNKLQHVRVGSPEGPEVMSLEHTARGPIDDISELENLITLGHDEIVSLFTEITSSNAHEFWERES